MSYSFLDQQNKLSSLLGESNQTSDDAFPAATRNKELNRGEWQFAVDAMDLKEFTSGTITGMQIQVPTDWVAMYCLIIFTSTSQIVLNVNNEVSIKDWERYYLYNSDRPFYYRWDFSGITYLKFFGSSTLINGRTYNLYYFKKPTTELANSTDTSLHREEFREAIPYYAASQLMQQVGKFSQAAQFMSEYQGYVQRAKDIVTTEYINNDNANPDFGVNSNVYTDVEGQGYLG